MKRRMLKTWALAMATLLVLLPCIGSAATATTWAELVSAVDAIRESRQGGKISVAGKIEGEGYLNGGDASITIEQAQGEETAEIKNLDVKGNFVLRQVVLQGDNERSRAGLTVEQGSTVILDGTYLHSVTEFYTDEQGRRRSRGGYGIDIVGVNGAQADTSVYLVNDSAVEGRIFVNGTHEGAVLLEADQVGDGTADILGHVILNGTQGVTIRADVYAPEDSGSAVFILNNQGDILFEGTAIGANSTVEETPGGNGINIENNSGDVRIIGTAVGGNGTEYTGEFGSEIIIPTSRGGLGVLISKNGGNIVFDGEAQGGSGSEGGQAAQIRRSEGAVDVTGTLTGGEGALAGGSGLFITETGAAITVDGSITGGDSEQLGGHAVLLVGNSSEHVDISVSGVALGGAASDEQTYGRGGTGYLILDTGGSVVIEGSATGGHAYQGGTGIEVGDNLGGVQFTGEGKGGSCTIGGDGFIVNNGTLDAYGAMFKGGYGSEQGGVGLRVDANGDTNITGDQYTIIQGGSSDTQPGYAIAQDQKAQGIVIILNLEDSQTNTGDLLKPEAPKPTVSPRPDPTTAPEEDGDPFDGKYLEYFSEEHERYVREANRQHFRGLAGSPEWLKQVYLSYLPLDVRLYMGDQQVLFKETLSVADDGNTLLTLRTRKEEGVTLRLGIDALAVFERCGVSQIAVQAGEQADIYKIADIRAVLKELGQSDALAIHLSGINGEVTIVDANGDWLVPEKR